MAHLIHLKKNTCRTTEAWDPDQKLAEALEQRARFLDQYPQYQPFQNEIDTILDKAGSPENRMTVLALLIEAKLIELNTELKHLNKILLSMPAEGSGVS
jgi:hypothetical protein